MPLFEFKCRSCSKRFTALVGVLADAPPAICPSCGGSDLSKLMSRFAVARSEEDMLESISDPDKVGDLEDPANMRRFVKDMGEELGEDMEGEYDEYLREAEEGGGEEAGDDTIY
jgi:putative FmdB family regulatory protein